MFIQEMKIAEKKLFKKMYAADDRRLAADTKRGQLASSLGRHLLCIMGETMDFPDLKTKTSD